MLSGWKGLKFSLRPVQVFVKFYSKMRTNIKSFAYFILVFRHQNISPINSRLRLELGSRTVVVRVSKLLLYFANIR